MSTDYRRFGIPPAYFDGPAIGGDDQRREAQQMARSSAALSNALKSYAEELARERPARVPAPARKTPGYRAMGLHQLRPAFGRDPCPYCGTRGDLGCAHFAPCEGVPA